MKLDRIQAFSRALPLALAVLGLAAPPTYPQDLPQVGTEGPIQQEGSPAAQLAPQLDDLAACYRLAGTRFGLQTCAVPDELMSAAFKACLSQEIDVSQAWEKLKRQPKRSAQDLIAEVRADVRPGILKHVANDRLLGGLCLK